MRFILAVFIVLAIFLGVLTYQNRFGGEENLTIQNSRSTEEKTVKSSGEYESQKILFVPYWTLDQTKNIEDFNTLAYFGLAVDKNGIETDEAGYKNLEMFKKTSKDKKNHLVVRMLDSEIISQILQSSNSRKNVIRESVEIARANNFSGIILDLEFSAIPFESVIKRVTNFYKEFYLSAKENNLEFGSLIYGDTYFRGRPYEVKKIGENSDKVYLMAYDFHKARGNPGPNFPLDKNSKYDYDLKEMLEDFSGDIPAEKIVTVFGMFGYDWVVDEQGRGKELAKPKTTHQMEAFLEKCSVDKSCAISKDIETQILYDEKEDMHEAWFENRESVQEKIKYLNSQGLKSVGYWANSFWNSK